MDGILNLNKPAGLTSFAVVARVRRITGQRQVGHAGTLDPLATGVLPIFLGTATRVMEYLSEQIKTYRAVIQLGITTDTYDAEGAVTATQDASGVTREMVEKALEPFRGAIRQTAPIYSALKYHGQPLYKYARKGQVVPLKERTVHISKLELVDWQSPHATLEITCGKGTYIRSLAHDLGQALGVGAHLKTLVRLRVGPFVLEDAVSLSSLEEACHAGQAEALLFPPDYVLTGFPAIVVANQQTCSLMHGSPIAVKDKQILTATTPPSEDRVRAYDESGNFLGILRYEADRSLWQPEKIFLKECPGCHGHRPSTGVL